MKAQLLRTSGPMIPGGFIFHDPITGIQYNDAHTFFDERVKQVVRDRLANRRLIKDDNRVNPAQVAIEISEAQCARLNGDPKYCVGPGVKSATAPTNFRGAAPRSCPNCGSESLKPIYCKTCSSARITGMVCQACGHQIAA